MKQLEREDLKLHELDEQAIALMRGWLARGDGIAVYENEDLGHPQLGHQQFVSYGSSQAQLETDTPPQTLPDFVSSYIGGKINWRYQLKGVFRGEL